MLKIITMIFLIAILFVGLENSYSQEPKLATFQETAQILIDQQISNNATASITLQSTSNQEIRIPSEVVQKIQETQRVISVVFTNEENCVLGVFDESCIMINVSRDPEDKGVFEIQESSRTIGNLLIDDLNSVFDTEAKFHSVYIHQKDETNVALDTSGVVSGRGTISVVYTRPQEDTQSMYEKISATLIPKVIRDSGGFYEVARNLSSDENASMTFSLIPNESNSLYQLKLSVDYPNVTIDKNRINPLEFLQTDELNRSNYFSQDFYPLNSLLQVVVLSDKPVSVEKINTGLLPTESKNGQKIPTDITVDGWIFEPESGQKIDGKYLFGQEFSVNENELIFTLSSSDEQVETPIIDTPEDEPSLVEESIQFDSSLIILIIIGIGGAGAVAFYFKGYRK